MRNRDKAELDQVEGCTGACCAAFFWPSTLKQQQRRAESDNANPDDAMIADMLIELTPKEAKERARAFGANEKLVKQLQWKRRGHIFTCKHWDETTRLCTVYERRPEMCKAYPYGSSCAGCGMVAGYRSNRRRMVTGYVKLELPNGEHSYWLRFQDDFEVWSTYSQTTNALFWDVGYVKEED